MQRENRVRVEEQDDDEEEETKETKVEENGER